MIYTVAECGICHEQRFFPRRKYSDREAKAKLLEDGWELTRKGGGDMCPACAKIVAELPKVAGRPKLGPRAFVTTAQGVTSIVIAETIGQARSDTFLSARAAGYGVAFGEISVKRAPEYDGLVDVITHRRPILKGVADIYLGEIKKVAA